MDSLLVNVINARQHNKCCRANNSYLSLREAITHSDLRGQR